MFHAFPFGSEASRAVAPIHGAVQGPVRPAQVGRHQVGIVEVGQRCPRMGGAGGEHGLRQRLQFRPL